MNVGRAAVLVLTVVAVPGLVLLERGLGALLYPPEMAELRELFAPSLLPVAWALVPFALLFGGGALVLQRRLTKSQLDKLPADAGERERARARLGGFFVAACVPQIPALLASLLGTLGAAGLPIAVTVGLTTLVIVVQAVRAW